MANSKSGVPNAMSLLAIQAGGGFLALIPIFYIDGFALLKPSLSLTLKSVGGLNLVVSLGLFFAYLANHSIFGRMGELMLCRIAIFYDILMLGSLVFFTGGAELSVFAPLFGAILPVAMLIRDSPVVKWAYAAVFLLMFLVGLQIPASFEGYRPEELAKSQVRQWFLIFFFLFTLFPVVYSIMAEREEPAGGLISDNAVN